MSVFLFTTRLGKRRVAKRKEYSRGEEVFRVTSFEYDLKCRFLANCRSNHALAMMYWRILGIYQANKKSPAVEG